ncbi:hypothetical protein WJX72_007285 [[Myrmecia] bisecta]|uniref:Guanine nucleotide-binding protein subunit beta-like protein 1 n=1 Tax=[Myrmecia] bisecta TaxID=41462 RepID=A0AAW1Q0L0_9CHLO
MGSKPAPDPEFVLRGHRCDVQVLLFHPAKALLYSGDAGGEVKVWDLQQRRANSTHRLHDVQAGVVCLKILTAQQLLVTQGRDGVIKSWKINSDGAPASEPCQVICTGSYNFCRFDLQLQPPSLASLQPGAADPQQQPEQHSCDSMDSRCEAPVIAVAGSDPAIVEIWDLQRNVVKQQLKQPEDGTKHGMCMALQLFHAPTEARPQCLAAGYEDGTVAIWDLSQPAEPAMQLRLHTEPVMCLQIDSHGTGGVSGSADDKVVSFSLDFEQPCMHIRHAAVLPKPGIGDLALRPDDKIVASGDWDGKLRIFQYKKLKALAILQFHRAAITAVCFNQHDSRIASASRDGTIAVWSVFAL